MRISPRSPLPLVVCLAALIGVCIAPTIAGAQAPAAAADSAIVDRLNALTKDFQGTVVLHAKHLTTGREVAIGADTKVRTASTIKLPILCALEKMIDDRKVRWDERIVLKPEDKVSGSGILSSLADGTDLTIRNLAILMIIVSDNTATNLILDRITADAVNDYLDTLDLTQTRSNRKVRGDGTKLTAPTGWSRAGKVEENAKFGLGVSTPREMVRLLEMLHQGKVVNTQASSDIIEIMKKQQLKTGIGRHAPDEVTVASKSGSLDALRSDVGIAYTKSGPIAIAITVEDMPVTDYSPDNVGEKLIWELTNVLLDGLSAHASSAGAGAGANGAAAADGTYTAISNTAMGVTGDLTLSATTLTFARDQRYDTQPIERVPAAQPYAKGGGSWADLLSVPATAQVELRTVSAEAVGPKAPNKGLCAPAKTRFVALVSAPDSTGQPSLALAAFKGSTAPGAKADAANLCGTFRYAPRQ